MKFLSVIILSLFTINSNANTKSICGQTDDRTSSFEKGIGRLSSIDPETGIKRHRGCTVTLISDKCAITAGHCKKALEYAEFNTPLSSLLGEPAASLPEDTFEINQNTIQSEYGTYDWAVVEFLPNKVTGLLPGEVYRSYELDFSRTKKKTPIRITGYGVDKNDPDLSFTQQTHNGVIVDKGVFLSFFYYDTDTTGGTSGSAIINEQTQKIIGIHTNGGCSTSMGENKGQNIANIKGFKAAVKSCLNSK